MAVAGTDADEAHRLAELELGVRYQLVLLLDPPDRLAYNDKKQRGINFTSLRTIHFLRFAPVFWFCPTEFESQKKNAPGTDAVQFQSETL